MSATSPSESLSAAARTSKSSAVVDQRKLSTIHIHSYGPRPRPHPLVLIHGSNDRIPGQPRPPCVWAHRPFIDHNTVALPASRMANVRILIHLISLFS